MINHTMCGYPVRSIHLQIASLNPFNEKADVQSSAFFFYLISESFGITIAATIYTTINIGMKRDVTAKSNRVKGMSKFKWYDSEMPDITPAKKRSFVLRYSLLAMILTTLLIF